jgi:hypothetical protein
MKTKRIIIIVLVCTFVFLILREYNFWYNKNIKTKKKMYAVNMFYGPPNPTLVIDNLKYKDNLVKFYEISKYNKGQSFNFPLMVLPINDTVYIMGYTKDSLLVEVASYGLNRGRLSFVRVYPECLHETPKIK